MVRALRDDGCFVNAAVFPAVPMAQGGIRFSITAHHTPEDIDHLITRLAWHYPRILSMHDSSREKLVTAFKRSGVASSLTKEVAAPVQPEPASRSQLRVNVSASIHHVSQQAWDALFDGRGPMNHRTLAMFEQAFAHNEELGQNLDWRYVIVYADGRIVAATWFFIGHVKDDVFAAEHISERVENIRQDEDPSFLVSKAVVMGSPISVGSQLYLDRTHHEHCSALELIVEAANQIKLECGAEKVLLRDFTKHDVKLRESISRLGFVELELSNSMVLEVQKNWANPLEYLGLLDRKKRNYVRREILRHESFFEQATSQVTGLDEYYQLYQKVHARGRLINTFALPKALFREAFEHPDFDLVSLYRTNEHGEQQLASFVLSHNRDGYYTGLVVGIDYDLVAPSSPYKQVLYQMTQRANILGAHTVDFGASAELIKRQLGARPIGYCAFMCADDDFSVQVMANL